MGGISGKVLMKPVKQSLVVIVANLRDEETSRDVLRMIREGCHENRY